MRLVVYLGLTDLFHYLSEGDRDVEDGYLGLIERAKTGLRCLAASLAFIRELQLRGRLAATHIDLVNCPDRVRVSPHVLVAEDLEGFNKVIAFHMWVDNIRTDAIVIASSRDIDLDKAVRVIKLFRKINVLSVIGGETVKASKLLELFGNEPLDTDLGELIDVLRFLGGKTERPR